MSTDNKTLADDIRYEWFTASEQWKACDQSQARKLFAAGFEVREVRSFRVDCTCPSGDGSLRHPCPAHPTLADVQPGGRVRLGDALPRPLEDLRDATRHVIDCADGSDDYGCGRPMIDALTTLGILEKTGRSLWSVNARAAQAVVDALSAQPSPGCQGDAVTPAMIDAAAGVLARWAGHDDGSRWVHEARDALEAALAARQPVGEPDHLRGTTEMIGQPVREPVGYFDPDVLAHLTEGLIDPVGVLRRKPNGKSNVPVWLGPPAQAVDPADPWRGLYSPDLMPKLDGVNLYHVAHPDLPSWPKDEDEERGIGPLVTAQGFAMEVVFGEYPDDDGEEVDYCAWLASWTPDAPAGADWRMVCIQDTEDGPAAFYVRPLALIDSHSEVVRD